LTASVRTFARPPVSGLLGQASNARSTGQHNPRIKPRGAQRTKINLTGHLRTARADLIELVFKPFSERSPVSRSQGCLCHSPPVLPSRQLTCKTLGHSERPELAPLLYWLLPGPTLDWQVTSPTWEGNSALPHRRHSVVCDAGLGSKLLVACCSVFLGPFASPVTIKSCLSPLAREPNPVFRPRSAAPSTRRSATHSGSAQIFFQLLAEHGIR